MKITYFYVCPSCSCNWSQTLQLVGMSFLDSSCACPACEEECIADDQQLS